MDKTGRHLDQYLSEFHPATPEPKAYFFYTSWAGQHHQMSQDNIAYLLNKHATAARKQCPDLP